MKMKMKLLFTKTDKKCFSTIVRDEAKGGWVPIRTSHNHYFCLLLGLGVGLWSWSGSVWSSGSRAEATGQGASHVAVSDMEHH